MSKPIESLNNDLFNSFNPQDEPWVVGGTGSGSFNGTFGHGGTDAQIDGDIDFDTE